MSAATQTKFDTQIAAKIKTGFNLKVSNSDLSYLRDYEDGAGGEFHSEICVDLEALAEDNLEEAFKVILDVHNTMGMSFREYYNVNKNAKLPHGVYVESLAEFCAELWEKRKQLTAGFSTENHKGNPTAKWNLDEETEIDVQANVDFWKINFYEQVRDLPCMQIYDLAASDNFTAVMDAVVNEEPNLGDLDTERILDTLYNIYENNNEIACVNFEEAAQKIYDSIHED